MDSDNESEETATVPQYQNVGKEVYAIRKAQLIHDYIPFGLKKKIVDDAVQIYLSVLPGITLKRNNRKGMMWKCAYEAFGMNNICKDPIILGKSFELNIKQMCHAQEIFYANLFAQGSLHEYPKKHYSATELLNDIGNAIGIEDIPFEYLEKVIQNVYMQNTLISRTAPRDVAISVLFWYSQRNMPKGPSKNRVKELTGIAETNITKTTIIIDCVVKNIENNCK